MNKATFTISAIALAATGVLQPSASWASQLMYPASGTITGATYAHEITVDGKTYPVAASPGNDDALLAAKRGDRVDMILSGPASNPGVHVVSLTVHPAPRK